MREALIQYQIRLAIGARPDVVLWRNNTGVAKHRTASVRYGLCVGSSDLVGILTMPDGTGRFLALECKAPDGRTTKQQEMFLSLVRKRGGFAAVVRSVDEAQAALERALNGASQ